MRPPRAKTGCGPRCARRRCGSAACWPDWCRSEPEVHGLLALMEIQASRVHARVDADGDADPAARTEPRALGSPADPARPGGAGSRAEARRRHTAPMPCRPRSPPATRAHCGRKTPTGRGSPRCTPRSPGAAVAGGRTQPRGGGGDGVRAGGGAGAGRRTGRRTALKDYHLLPSVRGDFLARLGRRDEARAEFQRAASLARNERERRLLLDRAAACAIP